jgi:ribosomal-protein-alanine N-acetyltransferase
MLKNIDGDKINLRQISKSDAMSIYRYARDEAISRYTFIPHPYRLDDAYEFIKLTHSARRRKSGYHFGVETKDNGQIIGMVGLIAVNHARRNGEIGYWLAKPFWGQGLMAEAIKLMLRFCFVELKLHRVQAHVFPANKASLRLLEKAGFTREGLIREAFLKNGEYVDCYVYSILEDDWGRQSLRPNP